MRNYTGALKAGLVGLAAGLALTALGCVESPSTLITSYTNKSGNNTEIYVSQRYDWAKTEFAADGHAIEARYKGLQGDDISVICLAQKSVAYSNDRVKTVDNLPITATVNGQKVLERIRQGDHYNAIPKVAGGYDLRLLEENLADVCEEAYYAFRAFEREKAENAKKNSDRVKTEEAGTNAGKIR